MDTNLAKHIEKLMEKLQSPNANTRYEACEYLRVAPEITPEALKALQNALNDTNADVAEAAKDALNIHLPPVTIKNNMTERTNNIPQPFQGKSGNSEIIGNISQSIPGGQTNNVATTLQIIAWLTYVGGFVIGLILGFGLGNVNEYGSMVFSFSIAIIYWVAAFISGTVFLGFAEIISLLQKIVDK